MTPLEINILLHYYCCASDFRGGDFTAPAVREAIDHFRGNPGLLMENQDRPRGMGACYAITERGRAHVRSLCEVQLPIQKWVTPTAA